jgi:hypothetical protein
MSYNGATGYTSITFSKNIHFEAIFCINKYVLEFGSSDTFWATWLKVTIWFLSCYYLHILPSRVGPLSTWARCTVSGMSGLDTSKSSCSPKVQRLQIQIYKDTYSMFNKLQKSSVKVRISNPSVCSCLDEWTIKTPKQNVGRFLSEFIDWRYSQSCWYFRSSFVNCCPSNLLSGSTPLPPPSKYSIC